MQSISTLKIGQKFLLFGQCKKCYFKRSILSLKFFQRLEISVANFSCISSKFLNNLSAFLFNPDNFLFQIIGTVAECINSCNIVS